MFSQSAHQKIFQRSQTRGDMSRSRSLTTHVKSLIQEQTSEFLGQLEAKLGETPPIPELTQPQEMPSKDAALNTLTVENKLVHYLCTHL